MAGFFFGCLIERGSSPTGPLVDGKLLLCRRMNKLGIRLFTSGAVVSAKTGVWLCVVPPYSSLAVLCLYRTDLRLRRKRPNLGLHTHEALLQGTSSILIWCAEPLRCIQALFEGSADALPRRAPVPHSHPLDHHQLPAPCPVHGYKFSVGTFFCLS